MTPRPKDGEKDAIMTREAFLAQLREMPPGPAYGFIADHDAALRAEVARLKEELAFAEMHEREKETERRDIAARLDAEIGWRQELLEALYRVVHSVNWKNWPAISNARARMEEAAALVPDYDEPEETGQ